MPRRASVKKEPSIKEKMAKISKRVAVVRAVKKTAHGVIHRGTRILKAAKTPIKISKWRSPQLGKWSGNPIIEPNEGNDWESQYTFNPAAIYEAGKVHLVYRAIGSSGISVFGYAGSADGVHIEERLGDPAYVPSMAVEGCTKDSAIVYISNSGGSWGGAEDPRMTRLEGKIYMTYTAFNGYPRVALTSIDVEDFLAKRWKWKEPILLSPPGQVHKNWVIFPEKIKGKYAILHGVAPKIFVEYFNSLDFKGEVCVKSTDPAGVPAKKGRWDSRSRGVGPPPIKTKEGWLIIYHATDDRDPGKYKMGAMILDYGDPTKILYRASEPILEPDERYETEGFKAGVVYCCGAIVKGGELFVYYGGADTVSCVATANLNDFVDGLKQTGAPKIRRVERLRASGRAR